LKRYLPIIDNKVIFTFLAKIPQQFMQEDRREIELLGFFINYIIEQLLVIAWTVPKINKIVIIFFKKLSEFSRYYC